MDKSIQQKRDKWLKMSQDILDSVSAVYGTYLESEIERYAQFKLAQSRQSDFNEDEEWGRVKEVLLWLWLVVLGVGIFSLLPRNTLGKTSIPDWLLFALSGVLGSVLTYTAHSFCSSFFKKQILHSQYKLVLEGLQEEETAAKRPLNNLFLQTKMNCLKNIEKFNSKPHSTSDYLWVSIFLALEIAAVYATFALNDNSANYVIMISSMVFSITLLLGTSYITARFKEVPKENQKLKRAYAELEYEVSGNYTD
jgi:hypothetical protein